MAVLLFLVFVIVPVLEIWVLIEVGQVIGAWWTVALLLADAALGTWLVRREGRRTWRTLRDTATSGRLPDRELADAGLVLVGGTLLVTPGFLTDIVGFFLVLPVTRPLARRLLAWFVARRFVLLTQPPPGRARQDPRVIPGEVYRRDDPDRPSS
jgi:UPF0716 protein FxsA